MAESTEILDKAKEILNQEGILSEENSSQDKLKDLILPALSNARDVQSALFSYEPPYAKGFLRKIKNFILVRIRNITVNIMQQNVMKQQKFNELAYQAIVELAAENEKLKQELSKSTN